MSRGKEKKLTGSLGYKLKKTQHALRLKMDEELRMLHLTTPQYAVLAQLELRPGISSAALARASFITAQTMHGIISNLESRQLIKRKRDTQHGRILLIELTKKGAKTVEKAHQLIEEIELIMTRTISKGNKSLLEELLTECMNNLGNFSDFS